MKTLIFGASGQAGQAIAASAPPGATVRAIDRSGCDIADAASVLRIVEAERPDLVVNAAAFTAVDAAEREVEQAYAVNRDGAGYVAAAAARIGARLVHISTDFVFDGTKPRPYGENDARAPLSFYGASKAAGEDRVAEAAPDSLVLRTAWVYGVGGRNFVMTMLRLMGGMTPLRVVADQVGTPTHTRSLADTLWRLVDHGATGLYHVTDAGVASWYDFAVAIQELAFAHGLLDQRLPVVPIATADYPTPAARPPFSVLDKHKCWHLLGTPARHWRDELDRMIGEVKEVGTR